MEFAIRDLTHAGKTRDIRAATSDFITLMNENHVRSTLLSHWPHLGTGLIPQKKRRKEGRSIRGLGSIIYHTDVNHS